MMFVVSRETQDDDEGEWWYDEELRVSWSHQEYLFKFWCNMITLIHMAIFIVTFLDADIVKMDETGGSNHSK